MFIKLTFILTFISFEQIYGKNVSDLSPIDKKDEVLAFLFNYGDLIFEYPSIIKLNKVCNSKVSNGLAEMVVDLIRMITQHYKNNVAATAADLMFNGPLKPDDECKKTTGPMARAGNNQIKILNARRFDAKDNRNFLEIALTEATQKDTEFELPLLACYLRLWVEKTIEKYPVKNGIRKRVKEHTHKTFDRLIAHLEKVSKDKVHDCDFMNLPEEKPHLRFKSIQMNLLEAIDNLTKRHH